MRKKNNENNNLKWKPLNKLSVVDYETLSFNKKGESYKSDSNKTSLIKQSKKDKIASTINFFNSNSAYNEYDTLYDSSKFRRQTNKANSKKKSNAPSLTTKYENLIEIIDPANIKVDPNVINSLKSPTKKITKKTVDYNVLQKFYNSNFYPTAKKILTNKVKDYLGFDINNKFGYSDKAKLFDALSSLPEFVKQETVLCLNQDIFDAIMNSPKTKIDEQKNVMRNNLGRITHKNIVENYYCVFNGQYVLVRFTKTRKFVKANGSVNLPNGISEHDAISIQIILNENVVLDAYRADLDPDPKTSHSNLFSKDNIPTRGVKGIKGPHEHLYSEKFCVVFPVSSGISHWDVKPLPKMSILACEQLVKSKFGFGDGFGSSQFQYDQETNSFNF